MKNEKLIALRKSAGLTQKQVAELLNIDLRTYGRYELGEIALGDIAGRRLIQISKLFNTSVDSLLSDELPED